MAVSKMSMFALATSFTAMRPSRCLSSSVMQSVSTLVSCIMFQAAKRLISASMPGCFCTTMSLICGVTEVMSGGSSKPKCLSTNAVSRLRAPARLAS